MNGRPRAAATRVRLLLRIWLSIVLVAGLPLSPAAQALPGTPSVDARRSTGATSTSLTLQVAQVEPAVATPGKPVTVSLTVSNTGTATTTGPVEVSIRLGSANTLLTRAQVRAFAAQPKSQGRLVARSSTPTPLAAQATTTVNMVIPSGSISSTRPYGVLPMTVQARVGPAADPSGTSGSPATPTRPGESGSSTQTAPAETDPARPGAQSPPDPVLATFLPFQSRKEYQPLDVAVVAPLTLDADPELIGATGAERASAWSRAIGPGSRIERILDATEGEQVTWAVDPTLLGRSAASPDDDAISRATPGATPGGPSAGATSGAAASNTSKPPSSTDATISAAPAASATPATATEATSTAPEPEPTTPTPANPPNPPNPTSSAPPPAQDPAAPVQEGLRRRLESLAVRHPVWALPPADPDLSALVAAHASDQLLTQLLGGTTGLARALQVPGVARVAWPIGTPLDRTATDRVAQAFGAGGPTAQLVPAETLDGQSGVTAGAVRRTPAGQLLLAYDDELSRLLTSTTTSRGAGAVTQQMLAESVTLLNESPGRRRPVLLAAGRDLDPESPALTQVLTGLRSAPWIHMVSTGELLDPQVFPPANTPGPMGSSEFSVSSDPDSRGSGVDGPSAADIRGTRYSPLTTAALMAVEEGYRDVRGLNRVLSATSTSAPVPDPHTFDALLSSRWRADPASWRQLYDNVEQRLKVLTTGVTVVPSTINFFAEHGIMQVTVVNRLDVEVHDIHLVLDPQGRPPRLRVIQEPPTLTIRPGSRTTVRIQVEAVAAGVVPVSAHLATPENTRLGTDATVSVRVQPTNGWIMLALGGLTGVVFLAGLYRALRAGRPRVTSEALKEIDRE